jgi:hypothetical protein
VDPTVARRLQGCWPFRVFSRIFPADAALGLSARIIGEKNTAVNRIFDRVLSAKRYILTNHDPETIHISRVVFLQNVALFRGGVEQAFRCKVPRHHLQNVPTHPLHFGFQ